VRAARGAGPTLALAAASLLLALVAAETGLRLTHPPWAIPYPPVCFWPRLYEQYDAHGYRLWPSRRTIVRYPPGGRLVTITSNSDGFRSRRHFRAPDPRPRIVVLGDSMVFGPGVEEPERFTDVLEAMEPAWRVDNLGMTAYGPDLMLRALERVGVELRPEIVVFAVFSHDFYRVMPEVTGVGFPLPRFELRDGQLVTVPYPARPVWMRLMLVQGVRYLYWRYAGASFPLNAAILDSVRTLAGEHRFVPALVFIPPRQERWDDRQRRAWLRAYAERFGMAFADLTPALATAGGERLYISNDAHWNPTGHRVVAEALRPFLAGLVERVGKL
jgi:hypothetical protein